MPERAVKSHQLAPSLAIHDNWLSAHSPIESFGRWEGEQAGKWCIFLTAHEVDEAWANVRLAVLHGHLPLAKVSTAVGALRHRGRYVICVYNRDWRDDAVINRTRDVLRELGFTSELGYKRDIETIHGVYGVQEEWYKRA